MIVYLKKNFPNYRPRVSHIIGIYYHPNIKLYEKLSSKQITLVKFWCANKQWM